MNYAQGRDVAIIGGGIGGLTAALTLARKGARVRLFEQAPAFSDVGAGIQISPNASRVLGALGLAFSLDDMSVLADAVEPMSGLTGETVARFDLRTQMPRYRFFRRSDLIEVLYQACVKAGVIFHFGSEIPEVYDDGSFRANDVPIDPQVTIGADGLHSIVRPAIIGEPEEAFFTGQVAWRGIIPQTDADPVARIWMAPGKHVVTYPLRGGGLNVIAVQERDAWAAEGWQHPDSPSNLQKAFADCAPELRATLDAVENPYLWGLFRHPVAEHWYKGSLVMLGDAAHPTLPFLAQGANLAIEDAYVLGTAIAENQLNCDAFRMYQLARRDRVERAIKVANANARNYHFGGLRAKVAKGALERISRLAPAVFLHRLSWLYDHDVTEESYAMPNT